MREHSYGSLDLHKVDYERLLDDLRDIMDAFDHAVEVDSVDLAERLEVWFSRHFRTHDAELHQALGTHPH